MEDPRRRKLEQFKGKVKEQWGNRTDDEVDKMSGSATSSKASFRSAMARQGSGQERY